MAFVLEEELNHMTGTKGAQVLNDAEGIVEAVVSGAGNKDSVGDVVMPGAFAKSLASRKPRVVWGHDWNHPIGKVLEIYEIPGSDPRVPDKAKGKLTAALYVKVQFNLLSEKGREAFSNVAFFGPEQEWSIGYKTSKSDYDPMIKANRLHEVELFEVSPVLHGANAMTGTVSVKNAESEVEAVEEKGGGYESRRDMLQGALATRGGDAPVAVRQIEEDSVIYQTNSSDIFSVSYAMKEDGEVLFGAPSKVRMEMNYVPDVADEEDEKSAASMEEDLDMDSKDYIMGYETEIEATERSMSIGCVGFHEQDGRFYPCEDSVALRRSMRSMRSGSKEATVEVAGGACGCGGTCGGSAPKSAVVVTVDSDIDSNELKAAVSLLNVEVVGKQIFFGSEVSEPDMKSALAEVLAEIGVTSVSISRFSE